MRLLFSNKQKLETLNRLPPDQLPLPLQRLQENLAQNLKGATDQFAFVRFQIRNLQPCTLTLFLPSLSLTRPTEALE